MLASWSYIYSLIISVGKNYFCSFFSGIIFVLQDCIPAQLFSGVSLQGFYFGSYSWSSGVNFFSTFGELKMG